MILQDISRVPRGFDIWIPTLIGNGRDVLYCEPNIDLKFGNLVGLSLKLNVWRPNYNSRKVKTTIGLTTLNWSGCVASYDRNKKSLMVEPRFRAVLNPSSRSRPVSTLARDPLKSQVESSAWIMAVQIRDDRLRKCLHRDQNVCQ